MLDDSVLAHRRALGAVRAEVERRLEDRFLPRPHAVLDRGVDRAAHRAVRADGALLLDLDAARFLLRPAPARSRHTATGSRTRPAPAASPERLRNVRRSIVESRAPASLLRRGPDGRRAVGLAGQQHGGLLGPRRRVVVAHVLGFAIALRGVGRRGGRCGQLRGERLRRHGGGARAARTECEQEAATLEIGGRGVRGGGRLRVALAAGGSCGPPKEGWRVTLYAPVLNSEDRWPYSMASESRSTARNDTSEFCYARIVVGNCTLRYCVCATQYPRRQVPLEEAALHVERRGIATGCSCDEDAHCLAQCT